MSRSVMVSLQALAIGLFITNIWQIIVTITVFGIFSQIIQIGDYHYLVCLKRIESLQKTIEKKDITFASLIHELRNPLGSILGSLELLKSLLKARRIYYDDINDIL
jgi:signal transduction histidine kinase